MMLLLTLTSMLFSIITCLGLFLGILCLIAYLILEAKGKRIEEFKRKYEGDYKMDSMSDTYLGWYLSVRGRYLYIRVEEEGKLSRLFCVTTEGKDGYNPLATFVINTPVTPKEIHISIAEEQIQIDLEYQGIHQVIFKKL